MSEYTAKEVLDVEHQLADSWIGGLSVDIDHDVPLAMLRAFAQLLAIDEEEGNCHEFSANRRVDRAYSDGYRTGYEHAKEKYESKDVQIDAELYRWLSVEFYKAIEASIASNEKGHE